MRANIPKGFGGPANMNQLMQQAQKMQDQLADLTEVLEKKEHEITGDGGLCSLIINGKYEVSNLKIDPSLVDDEDIELLSDVITATVNKANAHISEYAEQEKEKIGVNF